MSDRVAGATVAVIGFGNQGEAHALNLRGSGADVIVGARPGHPAEAHARELGFPTFALAEAARRSTVVAMLLPDEVVPTLWASLAKELVPNVGMVFAHGFNLLYGALDFPAGADVVLVSPTGPGAVLKQVRDWGERLPAYLAVHRDGSSAAWDLAESYALRLSCWPLKRTTVREETEIDLFGEQAVLCGGMNALVVAAFETLVAEGYSPEIAYLECVHQLKYLADLLHERGMSGFRRAISGTALFGDLTRGPRVIGEASRREMRAILGEIRSGAFAREWRAEVEGGRHWLEEAVGRAARHPIEPARERALASGSSPDSGDPESRNAMSKN